MIKTARGCSLRMRGILILILAPASTLLRIKKVGTGRRYSVPKKEQEIENSRGHHWQSKLRSKILNSKLAPKAHNGGDWYDAVFGKTRVKKGLARTQRRRSSSKKSSEIRRTKLVNGKDHENREKNPQLSDSPAQFMHV